MTDIERELDRLVASRLGPVRRMPSAALVRRVVAIWFGVGMMLGALLMGIGALVEHAMAERAVEHVDPPLPGRIYVLPCSYGIASRVCVFERVSEARYSEAMP